MRQYAQYRGRDEDPNTNPLGPTLLLGFTLRVKLSSDTVYIVITKLWKAASLELVVVALITAVIAVVYYEPTL